MYQRNRKLSESIEIDLNVNYLIPMNKGSRKYEISEVFKVWYENKDEILGKELVIGGNENYKAKKPKEIYHCQLHIPIEEPLETKTELEEVDEVDGGAVSPSLPPGIPNKDVEVGLTTAPPPLLSPSLIQWFYIDPSGNEQGPFSGDMMQDWLSEGYLSFDLQIRRLEESNYKLLKEFCNIVKTFETPFKVPLPDLTVVENTTVIQPEPGTENDPAFSSTIIPNQSNILPQSVHSTPSQSHLHHNSQLLQNGQFSFNHLGQNLNGQNHHNIPYQNNFPDSLDSFSKDFQQFKLPNQDSYPFKNGSKDYQESLFKPKDSLFNVNGPNQDSLFNGSSQEFTKDQTFQSQLQQQHQQSFFNNSNPNSDLAFSLNQSLHISNPGNQPTSSFHQFVSTPGSLGSANLSRQNNNNHNHTNQSQIFGNDFTHNDPFNSNSLSQSNSNYFGNFGIDPINHIGFNNNFNNGNPMPSILQHQIQSQHQKPVPSRNGSNWGSSLDTSKLINSGSSTPTPIQQQQHQSHHTLTKQTSQQTLISPWTTGVQPLPRVGSPFISNHNVINNVNNNGNNSVNINTSDNTADKNIDTKDQGNDSVMDDLHSVVTDILSDGDENLYKNSTNNDKNESISSTTIPESFKLQEIETKEVSPQSVEPPHQPSIVAIEPQDLKPSTPTLNKLAPWASQKENEKPSLSLKEIQKLDADRLEKQRQLEQQARAEQAAKLWAVESSAIQEKVEFPKSSGWATSTTQNVAPIKTLAEIQKEEAEAAALKARLAKQPGSLPVAKSSFAYALTNSAPKEDHSWVTVASKKQLPVKKATPIISTPVGAKASPQVLRSVSAARPLTSSINGSAIREDFIIWARNAMSNLYPLVSKNDLLDMFITLPANNPDSSALIAETIYSSSATMDGRRYAQEFMKKRQAVDKQLGTSSDLDWSSSILSSADKSASVDEEGWSTNSKSKKKGKKF